MTQKPYITARAHKYQSRLFARLLIITLLLTLFPVFTAIAATPQPDMPSSADDTENKTQDYEAWGREVNGLRCMFELVPDRDYRSPREQIGIRFQVENVSQRAIHLLAPRWVNESAECVIVNSAGAKQTVVSLIYLGENPVSRIRLEPNDGVLLDSASLGLAEDRKQAEDFNHPVGHIAILKPGNYSITFELQFYGQHYYKDTSPAESSDWEGTIVTGTRRLTVKARENGPTSATPVKAEQTPAKKAQEASLKQEAVFAALEQVVDLDFGQERTFSFAIDQLRSSSKTHLNLIVFWRDLERIGIDRDTPCQMGPIENVPLKTVLKLLLNAVAGEDDLLYYRVLDGVIVIATKPTLAKFGPYIRVYDVTDLSAPPAEYRTGPGSR